MINVRIKYKQDMIQELTVSGHAGYADRGEDLICAGVSSICIGLCNALDLLHANCEIEIGDNNITINHIGNDDLSQTVLQTAIIQLETVEEQANKYLKINKLEV